MKEITQKDFENEVLNNDQPVLVDFWAPWCGPCQMLGKILEDLDKENLIKIVKINVDLPENQELAQKFQISSIPNMIIFKDKEPVKQILGYHSVDQLKEEIKEIWNK